jgi:hypothetical protein
MGCTMSTRNTVGPMVAQPLVPRYPRRLPLHHLHTSQTRYPTIEWFPNVTHRTAILSDIEMYLDYEVFTPEVRAEEIAVRNSRLLLFPHAVLLQVAYPELDFANRWCWNQFGPADGECTQRDSQYRICEVDQPHSHSGSWMTHWLAKTDYDFGFNEWYFVERYHYNRFLAFLPELNWGEKFPKP